MDHTGGCLCGQIRFEIKKIQRTHLCHCEMCRRATGGAFAVLNWVKTSDLTWTGPSRPVMRRSSPIGSRSFCAGCGTPVALVYDRNSRETAIHAGTLDHPELATPAYNYHNESRLPWVKCGEGLPSRQGDEDW
jgi:hypothetical protein